MARSVTTYQVRVSAQPSPEVLASVASLDRQPLLLEVIGKINRYV